jgi:mRNA interferase MazF
MSTASRGEIWVVGLDPTKGREQAGMRPALVVSVDIFNHGAAELVVVIPITSKAKGIPLHVEVHPPEGGLTMTSFVKCEDLRSISTSRLVRRLGKVSSSTIDNVEDRLRILLGL